MEDLIITDEEARKLLDKAGKITGTDYINYSIQSFICALEDLMYEIDFLNDEIQHINQDVEDNYKPITKEEEICFNEKDFL